MNLRKLEFPRHVHKAGGSRIVATVAECEAAIAEGYIVIPPAGFVDDEPAALPSAPAEAPSVEDPPKRKPGRPKKQEG